MECLSKIGCICIRGILDHFIGVQDTYAGMDFLRWIYDNQYAHIDWNTVKNYVGLLRWLIGFTLSNHTKSMVGTMSHVLLILSMEAW